MREREKREEKENENEKDQNIVQLWLTTVGLGIEPGWLEPQAWQSSAESLDSPQPQTFTLLINHKNRA